MSQRTFADKLQSIDRRVLYLILIVVTALPLVLFKVTIPAPADSSSAASYYAVMQMPDDRPVILQSDWTQSTRGENMGHTEAVLRTLMSRNIKFVMQSMADPQAPQVFRDVMRSINAERVAAGLPIYEKGRDWVDLGYFANAENQSQAMKNDIRTAWKGRKTFTPEGQEIDIFQTELLRNVRSIDDFGGMIIITASQTIDIAIQRLWDRVDIVCFCTGVMGPQILPYFQSGQVKGVAVGLKGVFDMENMMTNGLNTGEEGSAKSDGFPKSMPRLEVPEGMQTLGKGQAYYLALHAALILLILAVVIGNVGMALGKKRGGRA